MNGIERVLLPVSRELEAGRTGIEVSELWGASRALFLCGLQRLVRRPLVVLVPSDEESETLASDLSFFIGTPALGGDASVRPAAVPVLPAWNILPFEADSPDSGTVGSRMRFLYGVSSGESGLFVVPVRSLVQKLPQWDRFAGFVTELRPGMTLDREAFAARLLALGYEHTSQVTRTGAFSLRGGILDLFSPNSDRPVRLELSGDAVESLREFDPETQRSTGLVPSAVVLPVRELLVEASEEAELERRGRAAGLAPESGGLSAGAESLAPFLYRMTTLFGYLPENSIIALIEPDELWKRVDDDYAKAEAGRAEETADGRALPETASLYADAAALRGELRRFATVSLRLLGIEPGRHGMDTRSASWLGVRLHAGALAGPAGAEGAVEALAAKLRGCQRSSRVVVVCGTEPSRKRMEVLLNEAGVATSPLAPLPADAAPPQPVALTEGRLSSGFSWPALGLVMITDEDVFGVKTHRPRMRSARTAAFLSSFQDLHPGDFVVHRDYGVGEYLGLTHLTVDGFESDYLSLRYEPDAKLYVPLYGLDLVQKYAGAEGGPPRVNRLGAPAWARTKEKVKQDLLVMARQIAAVSAARETMERRACSAPDTLYREFESAFPYEETPDQQKVIEEVLDDLQRPRPMDRLVCGDVGFGKTEVALRAAFKAVEDGRQVAVLVPTTLLADQHHRTFTERLGPFSVRVEMLSRFRTKAEQRDTLRGLKAGTIDIVIGTHRLLQRDVVFRDLGLLVVDEEHRFGVRHKERIKEMKRLVDVLTLTATPIPRTLHFSLAGIRDLSIIQTPPLDRQSIQVTLARFGRRVIREAIRRELERSGQVFFVHNRVQGIERMADFVQNLVPEARIGIAHGQMREDAIEDVMTRFLSGEIQVLVTTAIIESGIDIPNANTIIINRADRFGLAELYQIKGRVGRGRRKAYAYLLVPAEEALPEAARSRLRAIQELSELGAGFRIAAHDLETRGAGNLLGKQQSGHIAAVGIDLYTELLEEAVAELRGEPAPHAPDTQITLPVPAFLPEDYLGDMGLRLAAYKEISAAADDADIDRVAAGLADRYGPLPVPAANLLEVMRIKIAAREAMVRRIDAGRGTVSITFADEAEVAPDKVMAFLGRDRKKARFIPERTLQLTLGDLSLPAVAAEVKKCLQALR